MSQPSLSHRPISDVICANTLAGKEGRATRSRTAIRHQNRTKELPFKRRSYDHGRLVDVVYVRKHQTKTEFQKLPETAVEHSQAILQSAIPSASEQPWYKSFRRMLPVGAAALVLVAGLAVFTVTLMTNKQVVEQVAAESSALENDSNEEAPPSEDDVSSSAIGSYRVADPDMPRLVTINKIGVKGRIQQLGILAGGALSTPANVHDAGWYEKSSVPGEGGAIILAGHVHGPTKPGIFYKLKDLEAGDEVELERGDGAKFVYRVVKKEQLPAEEVDMSSLLLSVTPGKSGLNLITCGGNLHGTTYEDRVIVYTEQID